MNRTAIGAAIIASILAFSSPSLAASDEDLGKIGDKMRGAFRCAKYAEMFDDQKKSERLFQIGLKAGRDFVEGIKRHDPKWGEVMTEDFDLPGASTDFLVGSMYDAEATKADDEIRKYRDEQMRERTRDSHTAEIQAKLRYRDSNCSLIQ